MLLKAGIILSIIIGVTLAALPMAHAVPDPVTVTSTNSGGKTLLQITNSPAATSDIYSLTIDLKNGNFKSFTLQNGWTGKKTSPTTLAFITTTPVKQGDSTTFTISTDNQTPDIAWKAYDQNNNQIGTGEVGAPPSSILNTKPSSSGGTGNPNQGTNSQTTTPPRIILSTSTFRIIPSTPAPGFDVRVVGQSFTASSPLDLYIGGQKIDSFSTDARGNFVVTATVPQSQQPGSVQFVLKDGASNQLPFTTTITQAPTSHSTTAATVPLTVSVDPVMHPGDMRTISGTATPGTTATISILDSNGSSITTFTATADRDGKYSISQVIPNDRVFGKYTVSVTDGKDQVSKEYTVTTAHQLTISTQQKKYSPGDTVTINGTSVSNEPVSIVVKDPTGNQAFAKDVNVTSEGEISTSYTLSNTAITGTYIISASQGSDKVVVAIGVNQEPVEILSASLDKLNYQITDKPVVSISGPPGSTLNIVGIDPSNQEKFSDTISLGQDGFATYSFNLTSYTPGIYSLALTRGNDKVVSQFAVGLQTGCGQISLQTTQDKYHPGDNILLFGNANPNCIVQISLTDPNGVETRAEQKFTDKAGHFSAFDFRIPDEGTSGTWTMAATSGINHKSIPIIVESISKMTVELDKSPPTYSTGDIVTITGTGAGTNVGVVINILGTNNAQLQTLHIQSTNRGDYSTEWLIPKNFGSGTFTVEVSSIAGKVTTPITIQ